MVTVVTKPKKWKVTEELWYGVDPDLVEQLQEETDELRFFFTINVLFTGFKDEELLNVLKDGRKWKNCPMAWEEHPRVRYADYKGSFKSHNA